MFKLFKRKRQNTAIHPEYKRLVEKVASIEGRELYAFKNVLDMPLNRYNQATRFSTEITLRLDADILKNSIDQLMEDVMTIDAKNYKRFKKKVMIHLSTLNQFTEMLISPDAYYRLASCIYFWIDEDLSTYDYEIGDEKIAIFKRQKFDDFFLSEPLKKFMPQINISEDVFSTFSRQEKQLKKLLSKVSKIDNESNVKKTG